MKFEKIDINGHLILRIYIDAEAEYFHLAQIQSLKKAEKVHKDSPSGRRRDFEEIRSQNFLGTLADIVCTEILRRYFKKHSLDILVTRYDDIRTDDYKEHDLYDLKLSSQGQDYLVEIRSSVCLFLPLHSMIYNWQILGAYVSDVKGTTETDKPFYLRPIYHLSSYAENRITQQYQRTSADELVRRGELQLYFVGGATSLMLQAKGRNESGQELKQGRTQFRVLDIADGLDAKEILETIGEIAQKRIRW